MLTFPLGEARSEPFAYVSRRARIEEMPSVMAESFGVLGQAFAKAGAELGGPALAHYVAFDAQGVTFDVGFPARPDQVHALRDVGLSVGETAGGTIMAARHVGPYETMGKTYEAMRAQMHAQGFRPAADVWEIYMSSPETPPDRIMIYVIWPVRPLSGPA